jgi:DNA helicase-2/ATP-dependent DNA helicase PcrA
MNLDTLNKEQKEAVLYNEGPLLILAGAGSGKTRVLTYKSAYLLTQGYKPWEIMALTFTNKAAREMKERIGQMVGERKARRIWMGTFHSVFIRFLREFADASGDLGVEFDPLVRDVFGAGLAGLAR